MLILYFEIYFVGTQLKPVYESGSLIRQARIYMFNVQLLDRGKVNKGMNPSLLFFFICALWVILSQYANSSIAPLYCCYTANIVNMTWKNM